MAQEDAAAAKGSLAAPKRRQSQLEYLTDLRALIHGPDKEPELTEEDKLLLKLVDEMIDFSSPRALTQAEKQQKSNLLYDTLQAAYRHYPERSRSQYARLFSIVGTKISHLPMPDGKKTKPREPAQVKPKKLYSVPPTSLVRRPSGDVPQTAHAAE